MPVFDACMRPVLIGSLPISDHEQAVRLVFDATPDIPLWVQLPAFPQEGMMVQFSPGIPGLSEDSDRIFIDTTISTFEQDLLQFYEDYLTITEGIVPLEGTRFAVSRDRAPGFFAFIDAVEKLPTRPAALKGQITGPVTLATGLTDQNRRAAFYDERLQDAIVKNLAMKARWQVERLRPFGVPVIVFIDEPALAGFGTSAFVSISAQDVQRVIGEVIEAIHGAGGLAGVHVCANTDWSLILDSKADVLSFDAYGYFDRLALYKKQLKSFFDHGRILAWGIVPTSNGEEIAAADTEKLCVQLTGHISHLESLGIPADRVWAQSLVTPSCGTGSLSLAHATKVLTLTKEVSQRFRGAAR